MLQTTSFTANNQSSQIATAKKLNREITQYLVTILAYGTFGGGTIAFYLSPDGGTTKIPLTPSMGGTAISLTANGMGVITTGHPSSNTDTLTMWATITGATSPSVTVKCYDNNG